MEQLQHSLVPDGNGGSDIGGGKFSVIGAACKITGLVTGKIRQQGGYDLSGHGVIIHGYKPPPIELRHIGGGHGIETAVGGETVDNGAGG